MRILSWASCGLVTIRATTPRFAAGFGTLSLSRYTSDAHQRQALERLQQQSVPIILVDGRNFEGEFASDYALLARHLAEAYREAGTIIVDEEPRFLVFVEIDREPSNVDSQLALPCFS